MEKKINPYRGRIPNWAKKRVQEDVGKYGFDSAFSYFAYDCNWSNLLDWEVQLWRAYDKYFEDHIQLVVSDVVTDMINQLGDAVMYVIKDACQDGNFVIAGDGVPA